VQYNTMLRSMADELDIFDKEFQKLMNNGPYGKSMENKRLWILLEIVILLERLVKLVAQPDFLDRTIYTENVVAVHRATKEIFMNKPIFVGQAILDISKTIMYNFFYNHLKPTYGDRVELLYMDTGTL
jgi:hypothetical protein